MTTNASIRANVETLINLGFSVEDAVRLATKAANPTVTATAVEPKQTAAKPKASTPAPKAEPKAPAKPTTSAKPKAEKPAKKPTAKQTAREESKSIDGFAVMAQTKFAVEKTVRTDNGAECYKITLADGQARLGKAEWYAVTKLFGEELYASYYRGAWSTPINPVKFLAGKGLSKAQVAIVTAAKAARKAARDAAKATA